ncbi:MAG TPA: YihY/virulence factor BrkB family protein [Xanthobacteraceae bacterium]|nr:YihY/virulence factor BrkB family protein [Xanthobacteraceae bacterium]
MLQKRPDLSFWVSLAATALLVVTTPLHRNGKSRHWWSRPVEKNERPFGEPRSSEEPHAIELERAQEHGRGRHATHPLQIPWAGWTDILWRTYAEMQSDRLLSIAGGVAFFVLLSIFPAITALVSAYGRFFNAATVTNNISLLRDVVPANMLDIIHEQANRIASNSGRALTIGIIAGTLVSLWSTMSGVKAMIDALNVIYEQKEGRSFIKLTLVALAFTLSGFATLLLAIAAVVVLPLLLASVGLGGLTETLTRLVRWPVLLLVLLFGLTLLYRYGPDRRAARWQWVSVGSMLASITWMVVSYLFSWYLASFANYNATYGSLGAVAGLMVWLWLSTIVVLLGAELNAEIEHQTARDSTVGGEKPLGVRGAVMADTVGAKQRNRGR